MSCCLQIEILNPPANFPSEFMKGGKVLVDVGGDAQLGLTRSAPLKIEDFEEESSKTFSVKRTPANDLLFGYLRHPNQLDNEFAPYEVAAMGGGNAFRYSRLHGVKFVAKSEIYELELSAEKSHWAVLAEEIYFKDLDLGVVEFTKPTILEYNAREAKYIEGNQGVYFPLINYGGWFDKNKVVVEDFRPCFNRYWLLKKTFANIGWGFRCPYLETDIGRRRFDYLLGENYGSLPELLEQRSFEVRQSKENDKQGLITEPTTVLFDTIVNNPDDVFNSTDGSFSSVGVHIFTVHGHIRPPSSFLIPNIDDYQVRIQIIKNDEEGNEQVLAETLYDVFTSRGSAIPVSTTTPEVELYFGDRVYVRVAYPQHIPYKLSFYNQAISTYYIKGDIIDLAKSIDPELTFQQYCAAALHFIGGIPYTEWDTRTVWFLSPYEYQVKADNFTTDQTVEQYYKEGVQTVTNTVCGSEVVSAKTRNDLERFVRLGFKKSSDAYIKKFRKDQKVDPLFSALVDRGTNFVNKTVQERNPLFEPTLNARTPFAFRTDADELKEATLDLPHLWDNEDGKISYDVGFRTFYVLGETAQIGIDEDGNEGPVAWRFEDEIRTTVPYAFQVANAVCQIGRTQEIPPVKIVYGGDEVWDMVSKIWRKRLLVAKHSALVDVAAVLAAGEFSNLDFRFFTEVNVDGLPLIGRLLQVTDYDPCEPLIPASIIMETTPYIGNLCFDSSGTGTGEDNECGKNKFTIQLNPSPRCVNATATDDFNSPVLSIEWERSLDEGETWGAYSEGVKICTDQPNTVLFRRTVTFGDACPAITRVARYNFAAQCQNTADIDLQYTIANNSIVALPNDNFSSTVATDGWTVAIDGKPAVSYTPGDTVQNFLTVTFNRTITFEGLCPDITISETYTVTPPQCANYPELNIEVVALCVYRFSIGKNTSSGVHMVTYQVELLDGNRRTLVGNTYDGEFATIYATVYYSDACPATVLSAVCPD